MAESSLVNLTAPSAGGSLGLFQQRPSQGGGSPAQLTDPAYAATTFYRHLVKVPHWQQLPLAVAAQDVQRSDRAGVPECPSLSSSCLALPGAR